MPRAGVPGLVMVIAVTILLALIFVFYWPQEQSRKPGPPRPKPLDTVALLERRVARDEERMNDLERQLGNFNALTERVTRLEQMQPTALPTPAAPLTQQAVPAPNLNAYALKTDMDTLAARVARLESQNPGGAVRSAAASLALANLVRATEGSGNFASELSTFAALMPDAPEAHDLAQHAHGIATERALASRFPKVAADAIAADRRARAKGWLAWFWVNLSSLVSIRRVGDVEGNDAESKLARASEKLRGGNLAGAAEQVGSVSGAARPVLAPWLKDAQARLSVDRDLDALTNRLAAQLSQGSGK